MAAALRCSSTQAQLGGLAHMHIDTATAYTVLSCYCDGAPGQRTAVTCTAAGVLQTWEHVHRNLTVTVKSATWEHLWQSLKGYKSVSGTSRHNITSINHIFTVRNNQVCDGKFQRTFSVQHLGDVQVLLSHLKGVVQISYRVILHRRSPQQRTVSTLRNFIKHFSVG